MIRSWERTVLLGRDEYAAKTRHKSVRVFVQFAALARRFWVVASACSAAPQVCPCARPANNMKRTRAFMLSILWCGARGAPCCILPNRYGERDTNPIPVRARISVDSYLHACDVARGVLAGVRFPDRIGQGRLSQGEYRVVEVRNYGIDNFARRNSDQVDGRTLWLLRYALRSAHSRCQRCHLPSPTLPGYQTPPKYGDYEAQRHWMELTVNLPPTQWCARLCDVSLLATGLRSCGCMVHCTLCVHGWRLACKRKDHGQRRLCKPSL